MKTALLFLSFIYFSSHAQTRRDYWAFGDSAGLQFSGSMITPITCSIVSNEVSASVSDNSGTPQFSVGAYVLGGLRLRVFSWNNQMMNNGDSLFGFAGLTQCAIIIPFCNDSDSYYIFHQGNAYNGAPINMYYSIVNMKIDSGKGVVTSKNIAFDTINQLCEKHVAVKHGNGRDWWIINHSLYGDTFVLYLLNNDSITGPYYQNIGSIQNLDNGGQMAISPNGDKLFLPNFGGTADLFDFDRCTGTISNWKYIGDSVLAGWDRYYGASFSYKNLLYYSTRDSLWQVDAKDTNPASTKILLWADNNGDACIGQHQLASNNKIYISSYRGISCSAPNTIYDSLNMHLTVIDNPDIQGAGCTVQPYSQYIGGHRTFGGLPNIPFYNLGPLSGSPCDTLTNITLHPPSQGSTLSVSYVSSLHKAFINAQHLKGTTYMLTVTDIVGRLVFKEKGKLNSYFFAKDLDCGWFSKGMYIVALTTNKEKFTQKFIKE